MEDSNSSVFELYCVRMFDFESCFFEFLFKNCSMNFILRLGWNFQFLKGSKQHTSVYSYEMAFSALMIIKSKYWPMMTDVEDALCSAVANTLLKFKSLCKNKQVCLPRWYVDLISSLINGKIICI